jgi:hypothetical protein
VAVTAGAVLDAEEQVAGSPNLRAERAVVAVGERSELLRECDWRLERDDFVSDGIRNNYIWCADG